MKTKFLTLNSALAVRFLIVLLLVNVGCRHENATTVIAAPPSDFNTIVPDSTYVITASDTTTLLWPESNKIGFKHWKTGISTKPLSVLAKKRIVYNSSIKDIDSSKRKVIPFTDSTLTIKKIPGSGYLIKDSDTMFAPKKVLAQIPKAVPVKMNVKPNAEKAIQYMDIEQGLTSQYFFQTTFDSRGYLWMASYGGGITNYDGNTIRSFTETEGLSTSFVNFVFEDSNKNLWIGTDGYGLMKYDGIYFHYYSEKQGFTELKRDVNTGMEDKFGNLWFGTDDGLVKFSNNKSKEGQQEIIFYNTPFPSTSESIRKMIPNKNGGIWLGSREGLYLMNEKEYIFYDLDMSLVNYLYEDFDENLWVSSENTGFGRFNGTEFEHFFTDTPPSNATAYTIGQGSDGKVYIGTRNNGLLVYDDGYFEEIGEETGLTSRFIMHINEDAKGNLWIGTWYDGIFKLGTLPLEHLSKNKSPISSNIISINEDNTGKIWLGSLDNGLYRVEQDGYSYVGLNNGDAQNSISTIATSTDGSLWVASSGHRIVSRLFQGEADHYSLNGVDGNYMSDAIVDSDGNLWLSDFNDGIIFFDGTDFHRITQKDGLLDDYVYKILEHPNGDIYFFSFEGLGILSDNTLTNYKLGQHYISSTLIDSSDNIWFGTNEGPIRLQIGKNEKHLRYSDYSSKKQLSNIFINSIGESARGDLWMGTDTKGLLVFRSTPETVGTGAYEIESINREDGFVGTGALFSSGFIDSKDNLWVGTKTGLSKLDLQQNTPNNDSLKLYLTDINVNTNPIGEHLAHKKHRADPVYVTEQEKSKLAMVPFFNVPKVLELEHDANHLTFTFGALEWQAPHAINYQFKLSGLDADWSEIGKVNMADYRNLSFGNYCFMVRAISKSGIWSETISYDFKILPPWWHTWWARILYGVGILFLIWSVVRYRISILQRRLEATYLQQLASQEALEEGRQMEKERIARELHDGVLGNLFGIRLGLDAFKNDIPGLAEQAGEYIKKLSTLERDIRRLSHGLSYSDVFSDNPFVKVVEELITEQDTLYPIEFDYKNDITIPWNTISDSVKYNLYRIIQETFRNIVKHSKASHVQVLFLKEGKQVILKITDDGIGLDPKKKKKGIGFKNIEARTKAIQGEVFFQNQEKGLLVEISFPF